MLRSLDYDDLRTVIHPSTPTVGLAESKIQPILPKSCKSRQSPSKLHDAIPDDATCQDPGKQVRGALALASRRVADRRFGRTQSTQKLAVAT